MYSAARAHLTLSSLITVRLEVSTHTTYGALLTLCTTITVRALMAAVRSGSKGGHLRAEKG